MGVVSVHTDGVGIGSVVSDGECGDVVCRSHVGDVCVISSWSYVVVGCIQSLVVLLLLFKLLMIWVVVCDVVILSMAMVQC